MMRGPTWGQKGLADVANISAIALLCLTTLGLQFTSTILLSDLDIGSLPGITYTSVIPYDFEYYAHPSSFEGSELGGWSYWYNVTYPVIPRTSTWQRNPPSYPIFAEYAKPADKVNGVDDTGVLLRAFLPFADADSRENIRNYSGKAFVLDSRVSCQRPLLTDLSITSAVVSTYDSISLTGTFTPSTDSDRLWIPAEPMPFNCTYLIGNKLQSICNIQAPFDAITGLPGITHRAGGLISEFANITDPETLRARARYNESTNISWGTPYLLVNVSSSYADMHALYGTYGLAFSQKFWGFVSYGSPKNKDAFQYVMQDDKSLRLVDNGIYTDVLSKEAPANLSISLCYTAFDTAKLRVELESASNRTEPIGHWEPGRKFYTVPDVNQQMGSEQSQTRASRGILQMSQRYSWVPEPEDARPYSISPFVQQFSNLPYVIPDAFPGPSPDLLANMSVVWSTDSTNSDIVEMNVQALETVGLLGICSIDTTLMHLWNGFTDNSGSLARSLSSMITVLSSMAYYDQMPQFQASDNVTQVFFTEAVYPRWRSGFWVIVTLLSVHVALVLATTTGFILFSHNTLLGNSWHSVAQLRSPEIRVLLMTQSMTTDREIRDHLRAAGMQEVRVAIGPLPAEYRIGIIKKES